MHKYALSKVIHGTLVWRMSSCGNAPHVTRRRRKQGDASMKSGFEMGMMLVITGITNFCMFPAIRSLYRQELVFEAFIGMFTMITSFLYHCCDSIDGPLWLTEGQWHRLDNIGSIMSFVSWSIYLMDLQDPVRRRYLQYTFLAVVLVLQEKNPWDDFNSVAPIVLAFITLFLSFAVHRRVPTYDYTEMRRGFMLLVVAVFCFIKGLDDDNDPFRFFHGCWHAFVGAAAYFNFLVLPSHHRTSHLPIKKV